MSDKEQGFELEEELDYEPHRMTVQEIQAKRAELAEAAGDLLERARAHRRQLSRRESARFDFLHACIDGIARELELREMRGDMSPRPHRCLSVEMDTGGPQRPVAGKGSQWRTADGREVRVLERGEKLATEPDTGPGIGAFVLGAVTGDWRRFGSVEPRVMTVGAPGAGGYLVPTPLSQSVIDLARNKARVFQAGAKTVELVSNSLKMARVAGDPTAFWRAENAAITPSDMVLEEVSFTAQTLAALLKMSVELSEDAQNIDAVVSSSLSAALALELDRVALAGAGSGSEPQGISGATGVQEVAAVGALTNYDEFSQAVELVWSANHEPNAVLLAPRDAGTLDRLKDSTNQPLQPPASYAALTKLPTAQIPTDGGVGSDESEAFVADWRELLVGIRTSLVVEASRQAADASSSAFSNLQVWVRAYLRADVQLARPAAFCVLRAITP